MYRRILLPIDGSDLALRAAEHGLRLAKSLRASAVAVYATPEYQVPIGLEFVPSGLIPVELYERSARETARGYLDRVEALARKLHVKCEVRHRRRLAPAAAIIATAKSERCDLIVMGSHGRSAVGQVFLGSVTARVLAETSLPILVHRDPKPPRGKR